MIGKITNNKKRKIFKNILKFALLLTDDEEIKLSGRMVQDFDAFIKHLEQDVDKKMLKSIVDKLSVEKEQVIEILQKSSKIDIFVFKL
jgi:radical SAM superfamily enzyme with C-terminal helix-hairpin-helix motif